MTNQLVYDKIEELYNSEKGKGFIKHLISAFIPVNSLNFYIDGDDKYDAITQKRGFSVKAYLEMTFETVFITAEIGLAKTEEEKSYPKSKLAQIIDKVCKHFNLEEGEDLSSRKMYYSAKSDKTLTYQTIKQLQLFALNNSLIRHHNDKKEEPKNIFPKPTTVSIVEGNENAFDKLNKLFN